MIETKKNEKSRLFFFFFYIFSLFFYRGCGGNFLFSFAKNALSLVVLLVKRLVVYLVVFDFAIFGNHSIYWASRCVVTWSLTWSFTWSLSWSVVGRSLGRFEKWCLRKRLYLLGFSLGRYLVVLLVATIPTLKPTPWPCPHQYPCISRKPCCLPHGRSTYQPSSGLSPACTDCL